MRLAIILLFASSCFAQDENPFKNRRFVASEVAMYAGIVSDGLISRYGTSHHCGIEMNGMFSTDGGHGFKTGKYFAINLGIAVPASTAHYFITKKVKNRWVRGISHFAIGGFGASHLAETGNWVHLCNSR